MFYRVKTTLNRKGGTERWIAYTAIALAFVTYGFAALDSPLLDRERKRQLEILSHHSQGGARSEEEERKLAEAYWSQNADVASDLYFGREGTLGIWGAREHFDRHGKREGRLWPKGTPKQTDSGQR